MDETYVGRCKHGMTIFRHHHHYERETDWATIPMESWARYDVRCPICKETAYNRIGRRGEGITVDKWYRLGRK